MIDSIYFWKDHLGCCSVDGESEVVETRGRDSNKKSATVVQVRDDEGWHGRHCGACPDLTPAGGPALIPSSDCGCCEWLIAAPFSSELPTIDYGHLPQEVMTPSSTTALS